MVSNIRETRNLEVQLEKVTDPLATKPSFSPSKNKDTSEYYYLTEDARENLKTYIYRGDDLSLLYQYILSPLALFLVNTIVPKSMAPNTITSIGLIWMISAYAVYWWYAPTLDFAEMNVDDGSVDQKPLFAPRWIFLWNGISILVYQTLDNMDGKQARRTGSGSPLGLIFDHGCDAINSMFGSANLIIGMHLSPSDDMFQIWLLVFGPFVIFYIATWEHYLSGEMYMSSVFGPSEGLLGLALCSFVSYWLGSEYWQQTDVFDSILSIASLNDVTENAKLRNCDLFIIALTLGSFQEILSKVISVTQKYKGSAVILIPMFVLLFCYLIIGYIDPNIWLGIPRTSLHLSMALFVEMTTELMITHTTAQSFLPWRWQLAPLIGITFWVSVFGNGEGLKHVIIVYAWAMGAYMLMKCICLVNEMCDVLGIWCFDIVTPRYRVKKANS